MKFKVTKKDFYEDNQDNGAEYIFIINGKTTPSDVCKFVTLVYDYYSPYHESDSSTRIRSVIRHLYPKFNNTDITDWQRQNRESIQPAKENYLEIQKGDVEVKAYNGLVFQLGRIAKAMHDSSLDIDSAMKYAKEMPIIVTKKRELEVKLKYRLQMLEEDKHNKDVSAIDRYHIANAKKMMENNE